MFRKLWILAGLNKCVSSEIGCLFVSNERNLPDFQHSQRQKTMRRDLCAEFVLVAEVPSFLKKSVSSTVSFMSSLRMAAGDHVCC